MAIEYNNNKDNISIMNQQRRKSSPECLFTFKSTNSASSHNHFLTQKQKDEKKKDNWIQSGKQSFKDVFHVNNNNTVKMMQQQNNIIDSFPPSPPHTPFLVNHTTNTTTKLLRSTTQKTFNSISSNNSSSYFSSSSYTNSITLPAAPVFTGSNFSSIKKKKKRLLLRASVTGSSSEYLFKNPTSSCLSPCGEISSETMLKTVSNTSMIDSPVNSHRNSVSSDIELATEIGQGLLGEVRRMQSILQERQDSLTSLELEKAENQQRISDLLKQLRYKNEVEERLNEDIWNLELTKQDLSHQIRQLSHTIARTQMELVKRERQSTLVQQELEALKTSQMNWQDLLNKTQTEYESTLSNLNSQLDKLRKEKDSITCQLDILKKEKEVAKEEEIQEENRRKKIAEQEIKSLQISLMQAHTIVENLQLDLQNEKQKKIEVDALLRESQETIESMQQQKSTVRTESWCQQQEEEENCCATLENESSSSFAASLEQEIVNAESRITTKNDSSSIVIESTIDNSTTTLNEQPQQLPSMTNNDKLDKALPFVMHTMIGEWLLKFTRNKVGHGISNKSHQRFFWLHPYTKTLYWSQNAPGIKSGELKAKSVSIESFHVDHSHDNKEPVIVIKSSTRSVQVQCINKNSHEKWIQSLNDLFVEDGDDTAAPLNTPPLSPHQPTTTRRTSNINNINNDEGNNKRNKRLSLLLQHDPPSTLRQKQKWRLSEANLDLSSSSTTATSAVQQQQQKLETSSSSIRFSSIRLSQISSK